MSIGAFRNLNFGIFIDFQHVVFQRRVTFTTGHSFVEHVKPMVTGYDEVELTDEELEIIIRAVRNSLKYHKR